jgi:hypothetical protein
MAGSKNAFNLWIKSNNDSKKNITIIGPVRASIMAWNSIASIGHVGAVSLLTSPVILKILTSNKKHGNRTCLPKQLVCHHQAWMEVARGYYLVLDFYQAG